jgi:hypothetical protein
MKYFEKEIVIHTNISDALPENHPLAYKTVCCDKCGETLHAVDNECMQTWFETDQGNYCANCFKIQEVIEYLEECIQEG